MAIRTKDELLGFVERFRNDENENDFIQLLEDISDTLEGGGEKRIEELEAELEELKTRMENETKELRDKYIARFLNGEKKEEVKEEVKEEIDENNDGEVSIEEVAEYWKKEK